MAEKTRRPLQSEQHYLKAYPRTCNNFWQLKAF